MQRSTLSALATGLVLALSGAAASADAFIYEDPSSPDSIPGVATYITDGAMMDGLKITAIFDGLSETLTWAATGASSGGVSGSGWSLDLSGDSFYNAWSFSSSGANGSLQALILDGADNFTLFDRTFGNQNGTPNSAQGKDFAISGDSGVYNHIVTYSNPVGIGANAPVGDLFHTVRIDFDPPYASNSFRFMQDTDNDVTAPIPEPSAWAMMAAGLGLVGFAAARRRRSI